ncbi:winged helix-turn-helix domain-containing protein [Streptosporangium sp. NPDC000509]|uniref:winged helix-turn-helix domain-containing protein n=1 Tax=Streptosporangium sp. NPDC000509 TaxID=3366186 RepID=UPI0036BDBB96
MTWGYRSLPIVFRVIHFRPDQPKSEQVLNEIRRRIQAGDYKPGYPIPGEPRMAEEFGIARRTARKVINALIAEGLVYTVRNIGTFVADPKTGKAPEHIEPEDDQDHPEAEPSPAE